ncbi:TPA: DUF2185 domain-containing protein [Vibrio vulnificus]|nr:DUF2185 domain-containing protein [Vibrio vulnificus]
MAKNFKLSAENIRELASGYGGCIATDMITVVGKKVGYFCRDEPNYNLDSGWCFMSGDETQEYMDEPTNHEIYDLNTIANYEPDIIPFLDAPVGSVFERNSEGKIAEIVE